MTTPPACAWCPDGRTSDQVLIARRHDTRTDTWVPIYADLCPDCARDAHHEKDWSQRD